MSEHTAAESHDEADRDLSPVEIAAIAERELRRLLADLLDSTEPA